MTGKIALDHKDFQILVRLASQAVRALGILGGTATAAEIETVTAASRLAQQAQRLEDGKVYFCESAKEAAIIAEFCGGEIRTAYDGQCVVHIPPGWKAP